MKKKTVSNRNINSMKTFNDNINNKSLKYIPYFNNFLLV